MIQVEELVYEDCREPKEKIIIYCTRLASFLYFWKACSTLNNKSGIICTYAGPFRFVHKNHRHS